MDTDQSSSIVMSSKTVMKRSGSRLTVPEGWVCLRPGNATLTKRVKAAGEHIVEYEKVRHRYLSRGVWAAAATISRIRDELFAEQSTETYEKQCEANEKRKIKVQAQYVEDFTQEILNILGFHACHSELARRVAHAVAAHATPIGSGTVARTKLIPIEERAEAALIAWMRHQTTDYDSRTIRDRDERPEVRRELAEQSKELLDRYRREEGGGEDCPLRRAIETQSGVLEKPN